MHWILWKNDDHVSIRTTDFELSYRSTKAFWQQSKRDTLEYSRSTWIFYSSKTFRSILSNSQTTTTITTTTTIGRKAVTLPAASSLPLATAAIHALAATRSIPSTPVEPNSSQSSSSSSSSNLILLRRTRSPNQSSAVVVVPRQTSDHCKATTQVSTRPNSMI